MIIDKLSYSGRCTCGRDHELLTKRCLIEAGALKKADAEIAACGMHGFCTVIYDENTYAATQGLHPAADHEIVLSPENLHANEKGVAAAGEQIPAETDYLIAVGAGTVHDITRYCAYERRIPFVSCPTAASVDGFVSSVAAMTWNGCKKTLPAVPPTLVLADLDVISKAPMRLTRSGFGDMIGKYIALADWKIGHLLTGEYFCERICGMVEEATDTVLKSTDGILAGNLSAYESLIYGLLLSGLAMQLIGNSRPASGAEHHVSHLIETEPPALGVHSDALHGEKVGVGTLLVSREYHRLAQNRKPHVRAYRTPTRESLLPVFGERLTGEMLAENAKDAAASVTPALLAEKWDGICRIVEEIPTPEALDSIYRKAGMCRTLADIGVPDDREPLLLDNAWCVRNRLTLMRLRQMVL